MADDWMTSDPDVLDGRYCFTGTRVPVAKVMRLHARGLSSAEILGECPSLTKDQIAKALAYADERLQRSSQVENFYAEEGKIVEGGFRALYEIWSRGDGDDATADAARVFFFCGAAFLLMEFGRQSMLERDDAVGAIERFVSVNIELADSMKEMSSG